MIRHRLKALFLEYRLARDLGHPVGTSLRFAWRHAIVWKIRS
jgi:hypothetical protein